MNNNKEVMPWDSDYNFHLKLDAPADPLPDEFIHTGGYVSSGMSMRYQLICDGLVGELVRLGCQVEMARLQLLRTIGVGEYDHPVSLDFWFFIDPDLIRMSYSPKIGH